MSQAEEIVAAPQFDILGGYRAVLRLQPSVVSGPLGDSLSEVLRFLP